MAIKNGPINFNQPYSIAVQDNTRVQTPKPHKLPSQLPTVQTFKPSTPQLEDNNKTSSFKTHYSTPKTVEFEDKNSKTKDAFKAAGISTAMNATAIGISKGVEKITEKAVVKGVSRLSIAVPVASALTGAAITAYDTQDAIKKTNDPKVSKLSAELAWATVGLEVISTGCSTAAPVVTATIVGAPIGAVLEGVSFAAAGLSIVTSALSEYYK